MKFKLIDNLNSYRNYAAVLNCECLVIGLAFCFLETKFISCLIGSCLILQGCMQMIILRKNIIESAFYSVILELYTWINIGHVFASLISFSDLFTNNTPLKYFFTPVILLAIALFTIYSNLSCKHIADNNNNNTLPVNEPTNPDLVPEYRLKHHLIIGILSALTFGLAEARIPHGLVPCRFFSEGVIGVLLAGVMFTQLFPKLRESRYGNITITTTSFISVALLALSGLYYGLKATSRNLHFQYGISMVISLAYIVAVAATIFTNVWFYKKNTPTKFWNIKVTRNSVDPKSQGRIESFTTEDSFTRKN